MKIKIRIEEDDGQLLYFAQNHCANSAEITDKLQVTTNWLISKLAEDGIQRLRELTAEYVATKKEN